MLDWQELGLWQLVRHRAKFFSAKFKNHTSIAASITPTG